MDTAQSPQPRRRRSFEVEDEAERRERSQTLRRRWIWISLLLLPGVALSARLALRPNQPSQPVAKVHLSILDPSGGRIAEAPLLSPGEAVHLNLDASRPGLALAVLVTERGEVVPCEPADGTSVPVAEGSNDLAPNGWVVPSLPGRARLYVLWTSTRLTVEDVRDAMRAAHTAWTQPTLPVDGAQASLALEIR